MSGTPRDKDVEQSSGHGSEIIAPSDSLSQIQRLQIEKAEKERLAQRQEEELSKLMRENSEMKARLERLEALLSGQMPNVIPTHSTSASSGGNSVTHDELTKELEKTQDLMAESQTLAKNLELITKMAADESQKLDQLQRAEAEQQAQLEEELRLKQDQLKQKEKDLEDIRMNRSNQSVSNSISKTHFQNSKQAEKHRNRENSKVSHAYSHNSWMESDEESVASSQNKSSARRYPSSYGQQKFVNTAAFVPEATNTESAVSHVAGNEKKRESPSRGPRREMFQPEPIIETLVENQTQATDPNDNPENMDLISPMKIGQTIIGQQRSSEGKSSKHTDPTRQMDKQFKKVSDKRPGGVAANKKPDGKQKLETLTRPAYADRHSNIRSYEDYYKKYKSHIKRGFELLEEEEYVLKGTVTETQMSPADEQKKGGRSMFRTPEEMREFNNRQEERPQRQSSNTDGYRGKKKDDRRPREYRQDLDTKDDRAAPHQGDKTKVQVAAEDDRPEAKEPQAVSTTDGERARPLTKRENSALVSTQPTIIEEDAQECATATEAQSVATVTSTQKKPTRRGGKAARLKRQKILEKYGKLSRDPNDSSQMLQSQLSVTLAAEEDSQAQSADQQPAPTKPGTNRPDPANNDKPVFKSALLQDLDLVEASDQGESSDEWQQAPGSKPPQVEDQSSKQLPPASEVKGSKVPNKIANSNPQTKGTKQSELSSGTGGRAEKGEKNEPQAKSKGMAQDKKDAKGPPRTEPSDPRKKKR